MFEQALIPAAGLGVRAYPKTSRLPKVLLEIDGKPLLLRNIELLRDSLGVRSVTIIVGPHGDQVRARLGVGTRFGVELRYVECLEPGIGLARGILLCRDLFREPFITILGDELYVNSNHSRLAELYGRPFSAVCAVMRTSDLHQIKRNYSVQIEDGRIVSLIEKPD